MIYLFILLQAADIYTTNRLLSNGGRELNPVMARMFAEFGVLPSLVITKAAACAAFLYLPIEAQVAPPTINLDNVDPSCPLNCVPNVPQERRIDVFVKNSFGFGGHNAVLVGRRFNG